MATEQKLTTVGQMRTLAEQQDARDDVQEDRLQQLEENDTNFLTITAQTLTDTQKEQVRANIGAAAAVHTHTAITTAQIDAILDE